MTNALLIKKILNKINYKNHKLSKPVVIDTETFTDIICYNDTHQWFIAHETWEIPFIDLTNRELIKLYQSL